MNDKTQQTNIVGKFFHSMDDEGTIEWQGVVLERLEGAADLHRLQLYSWWTGEETIQEVVPRRGMDGWKFYTTHAEWLRAYERYDRARSAAGAA
jgi:hypothetical protein